jgi:hypothetical protein
LTPSLAFARAKPLHAGVEAGLSGSLCASGNSVLAVAALSFLCGLRVLAGGQVLDCRVDDAKDGME